MKNFKCTLTEKGIRIEGDATNIMGDDYRVDRLISYEQQSLPWIKGKAWAEEQGGTMGTRAFWVEIQKHADEINEQLTAAGKTTLEGWLWAEEEYSEQEAWYVAMVSGYTGWSYKSINSRARAVSAFPSE